MDTGSNSSPDQTTTTTQKPPERKPEVNKDGGWGWAVVLGSSICHFFLIGINRSMGIVYLLLQERFDATGKETALAASIFVSIRALGGPIASKLSDRFGCRKVTMVGGCFLCLGLVLSAFATSIIHIYITFGLVAGVGGVLVFSPSYIAVSYWFDKKKGKAMSLSTLGTGFGSTIMAPTLSAMVGYYGYSGTMLVTGALMLNNSVGGAFYRKPPKNCAAKVLDDVVVEKNERKASGGRGGVGEGGGGGRGVGGRAGGGGKESERGENGGEGGDEGRGKEGKERKEKEEEEAREEGERVSKSCKHA